MSSKNQRSENKKNSNLRLISSTIKNLSKKGINDLTMNDVSQGAGLSQGIVNFHFKSKELLLIETLKFISNEYLTSFDKYLKKAGDDPKLKIINMIENDFSSKICSPEKISVWFTFFSEIKFKPAYRQICRERDLYYQNVTEDIFSELIKREKNSLSLYDVSKLLFNEESNADMMIKALEMPYLSDEIKTRFCSRLAKLGHYEYI